MTDTRRFAAMGGSGQLGTLAMSDVQVVPELLLSAYMIVAGVLLLVGRKRITRWCEWWMRLCRLPAGARFGFAT